MGDCSLEFGIANLRDAGRPAEYARTTDRSKEAAQG